MNAPMIGKAFGNQGPGPESTAALSPGFRREARALATMLYIDDDFSNREIMQMIFETCRPQWQVVTAGDAKTGLELAHDAAPDVILLDLHLPDLRGDAVLADLRSNPETRRIPVVIFSADATPGSRLLLLAGGADDYIVKPFGVEYLLQRLDRVMRKASVER